MIPQYAKSTDPEVIAVIRRNQEANVAFRDRIQAWGEKYGAKNSQVYMTRHFDTLVVVGIAHDGEPESGRWTQRPSGAWRPYKRNPAHAEMTELTCKHEPIPGMPSEVTGQYRRNGSFSLMTPAPFIYDGAAWVMFPEAPAKEQMFADSDDLGPQWVGVVASEAYAAREALTGKAVA